MREASRAAMDKHSILSELHALSRDLGRSPTKQEFLSQTKVTDYSLTKSFGTFTDMLKAAGLATYDERRESQIPKLEKKYRELCARKPEQIQGFFRNTIDIRELFERAGNPQSLRLSAQPDTHAKFVDQAAFNSYLKFLKYYEPHVHLIMGDFVDCEGLSHWPSQDMEPRRIVPELKQARDLLRRILEVTPKTSTRVFLTGNHEAWIEQALARMPELFDGLQDLGIEISLRTLLALDKFGYELVPLNHLLQIGKAHFTHGLFTGSNHAKKHLDTFKTNIYYAHLHDLQETNQTSMEGSMEAATFGCLCRLDAKFLKGRPNNWVHGHAVFEFFPDGSYVWHKIRIVDGKTSFNGQVFDGNVP